MKGSIRVIIGLVAGLLLGAVIAAARNPMLDRIAALVAPLGNLWVTAIRMCVIPLVMSLLVTGIASTSDLRSVGRLGGRSVLVFLGLLGLGALVMGPIIHLAFDALPRDPGFHPTLPADAVQAAADLASNTGQIPSLAQWVQSLLPANPIKAAADGAMIPLVLFMLLFAVAVTKVSAESRAAVLGLFKGISEVMLTLVGWVIAVAPLGVFALMVSLTAGTGLAVAGALGIYVVVYSGMCLLWILAAYPITAIFGGVPIGRLARALFPAQLIAVTTSSSIATLPALLAGAEAELDLSPPVRGFVLPLAISTFKYAAPVSWAVAANFVAWFYGIHLGISQLVILGVATIVLSFGSPGVPRGVFIMLTPVFQAVGIPVEGIGLLIAVDVIPDIFATALNVTGDMTATAIVGKGDRAGLLRG